MNHSIDFFFCENMIKILSPVAIGQDISTTVSLHFPSIWNKFILNNPWTTDFTLIMIKLKMTNFDELLNHLMCSSWSYSDSAKIWNITFYFIWTNERHLCSEKGFGSEICLHERCYCIEHQRLICIHHDIFMTKNHNTENFPPSLWINYN